MNTILAIDQGTSSTRARLYTTKGEILYTCQAELTTHYPQPGRVEQDGDGIWVSVQKVIQEIKKYAEGHKIVACGIANQRETSLLWQRTTGQCIGPAIVWQDRRTADWCKLFENKRPLIHQKTGLLPDPYFSASKIRWMLDNYSPAQPLLLNDDLAFGTVDSYLLWKLSNGRTHKTDVTNATRTMLFNLNTLRWDQDLLALFDIPENILPEVCASDSHFTAIDKKWFGYEIPVCAVLGDQQAALIGQCVFNGGMIKATYGTGGFLLMNVGTKPYFSENGLLTTIAYQVGESVCYGLEGSIYQAGTMIKWLRDEMNLLDCAAQSEVYAASLNDNGGVYLLPSFTGMGAPYWHTATGGRIYGLSLNTKPAHFARAALEAVSYQTCDVLKCMSMDTDIPLQVMRVDGGMVVNNWLLQRLADQCQISVQRPKDIETTAYGAAMMAAIGAGIYHSLEELSQHWQMDDCFVPESRMRDSVMKDYEKWSSIVHSYLRER